MTELLEKDRCGYCGAWLSEVLGTWLTKYGEIEVVNLECHNPRCPETKRRESSEGETE